MPPGVTALQGSLLTAFAISFQRNSAMAIGTFSLVPSHATVKAWQSQPPVGWLLMGMLWEPKHDLK